MKKGLFSILYRLDKNIWGEHINPNKYLATVTMLCCALAGIMWGGSNFLNGMFDWNINISLTSSIAVVIALVGYNIAESIIATDSAKIAALRALMMTGFMILGFVAGLIGSVILLIILTIIVGIYAIIVALKVALGGGSSGGKRIILDNGTELRNEQSDLLGFGKSYTGDDGKNYHTDDGHTFHQK